MITTEDRNISSDERDARQTLAHENSHSLLALHVGPNDDPMQSLAKIRDFLRGWIDNVPPDRRQGARSLYYAVVCLDCVIDLLQRCDIRLVLNSARK